MLGCSELPVWVLLFCFCSACSGVLSLSCPFSVLAVDLLDETDMSLSCVKMFSDASCNFSTDAKTVPKLFSLL